jgi:hypothetical protein
MANDNTDIKLDYNHFESKYFGENETYNNDKRQIIEDFYRQSALAAKSIQEMSFHLNRTGVAKVFDSDDEKNVSTQTYNEGNYIFMRLFMGFGGWEQEKMIFSGGWKSSTFHVCGMKHWDVMKWKIYVEGERDL